MERERKKKMKKTEKISRSQFSSLSLSLFPLTMAAEEPVEFTRGSVGAADTRGLSLVERHAEARARALEDETLARLRAIFGGGSSSSQVPLSVLALAASAAPGPDAREAEALVREFLADKGRELEKLFKAARDGGKAKPSTSSSDGDDESGDGSSDDSGDDGEGRKGRHRRSSKHSKKDSKKHSSKKHSSKKDEKKIKKNKKKRRRRSSDSDDSDGSDSDKAAAAKAAAKPTTTAALTSQFGSHGLLRAENPHDAELKRAEFFAWCAEVKKVASMEALARWEEAELWKTFVEDFNTATLPSEKYYDLAAWQAREDAKRKKGKKGGDEAPISAADDEAARRAEAKRRREEEAAERLKEAYNALKYSDAGKKEDMKRQELLKIELQVAARTGDTEKVARLQKLLAPDKT